MDDRRKNRLDSELRPQRPRVVAVLGLAGAGKNELAGYLTRRYNALDVEVGAFARALAAHATADEPYMRYDLSAKKLADLGPAQLLSRLVLDIWQRQETAAQTVIITGVRTPAEAFLLRERLGEHLLLVFVDVTDDETRYERIRQRNFASDPEEFRVFQQHDQRLRAEFALLKAQELADLILWNDSSLANFFRQIEQELVPELKLAQIETAA